MFQVLHQLLGKKKQDLISSISETVPKLMKDLFEYYSNFNLKLILFNDLKETLVEIKSQIYDSLSGQDKIITFEKIKQLQLIVDQKINNLIEELKKIENLVKVEQTEESEENKYSHEIIYFIKSELEKEEDYKSSNKWITYKTYLLEMLEFLTGIKNNTYGIFHLLVSQLNLFRDIETSRNEIETEISKLKNNTQIQFQRLKQTLRILEIEIMRFGKYLEAEAKLINPPKQQLRTFKNDFKTLRLLGLVYSESRIDIHNIGIITTKLYNLGKNYYGTKGIGLIHENNLINFRFVKGSTEKHTEVIQMLFNGIPGIKLSDDVAIRTYIHTLPLTKLTKIAGFELQLSFDKNNELKVANIDYASTILSIQLGLMDSGVFLRISNRDFERLNYALLFSIDKKLIDNKLFEMSIQEKGTKINVKDKRVFDLVG